MTIDEAIRRLSDAADHLNRGTEYPFLRALSLGIEALKLIKVSRKNGWVYARNPLPGETPQ